MYISFPADEKVKVRLDAICDSLNISLEEWFKNAIRASEYDVLIKFLDNPAKQKSWIWNNDTSQFVRRFDVE